MEASKPSSLSAKNILLVLTHKKTDSFINRMKWTKTAWESFHPKNECIILVDITKDSSVQKVLNENGLKTIGYSKNLVSDEIKESVERNNELLLGSSLSERFSLAAEGDVLRLGQDGARKVNMVVTRAKRGNFTGYLPRFFCVC